MRRGWCAFFMAEPKLERYKLIESNTNSVTPPKLRGQRLGRFDGAELTNVVPDAPVADFSVVHSLRHLSFAELSRAGFERHISGGSFISKDDLKGKHQPHIYG